MNAEKSPIRAHLDSIQASLDLIEASFASATPEDKALLFVHAKRMERINATEHLRMQNLANIVELSGRRDPWTSQPCVDTITGWGN